MQTTELNNQMQIQGPLHPTPPQRHVYNLLFTQ